jgi:hypothetical protein
MRRRSKLVHGVVAGIITTGLIAVASACSGDESSDASAETIEQIEQVCTDWRATLDERGEFPVEGFDPEKPSRRDLPAVAAYFAAGHPAAEQAIVKLRGLSPPAAVAGNLDALVTALEWQLEDSKVQTAAARTRNASAFTATLRGTASPRAAVQEASDQLGVEGCAF